MIDKNHAEEFYEIMELVMLRTGMYTHGDNFDFAAAYLQGYAHSQAGDARNNILRMFQEWLAAHFDYGFNIVWSGIISNFHKDDLEAKRESVNLFKKFMEEHFAEQK